MKIIQVDPTKDYASVIAEVINVLEMGGVVLYPTDTLYGLAANALNVEAVERVFKIKQRSFSKPLPISARNMKWVKALAKITSKQEYMLEKIWPGVVTAVLPKNSIVPDVVTAGHPNVAIRIPDYKMVDTLLGKYGYPLTMTSANVSGNKPIQRVAEIIESLSHSLVMPDLVIDVGTLLPSEPPTLIDFTGAQPKILHVGAAKPQQLMELLGI